MPDKLTNDARSTARREILSQRRKLSLQETKDAGLKILSILREHEFFRQKRVVASYIAVRGEVDTGSINSWLLKNGHTLALPVVDPVQDGEMSFYKTEPETVFTKGRYGISEPEAKPESLVPERDINAVLLPLVGFDLSGNRLGMGGGYYDRLLKKLKDDTLLIGIAYDFQRLECIETREWDMRVDEVITPSGLLRFQPGQRFI